MTTLLGLTGGGGLDPPLDSLRRLGIPTDQQTQPRGP